MCVQSHEIARADRQRRRRRHCTHNTHRPTLSVDPHIKYNFRRRSKWLSTTNDVVHRTYTDTQPRAIYLHVPAYSSETASRAAAAAATAPAPAIRSNVCILRAVRAQAVNGFCFHSLFVSVLMSVLCASIFARSLTHTTAVAVGVSLSKILCSKCTGNRNTRNLCKSIGTIYVSMVRTPADGCRMRHEVAFGWLRSPNEYGRWTWCFLLNAGTKHLRCVFYFMYTNPYEAIYYMRSTVKRRRRRWKQRVDGEYTSFVRTNHNKIAHSAKLYSKQKWERIKMNKVGGGARMYFDFFIFRCLVRVHHRASKPVSQPAR